MARDYGVVAPTFWTGETGRSLRARGRDAQLVAAYLMTSPHANMIGLYHLPVAYVAHDTGLSAQEASEALRRVEEVGFAFYDAAAEQVWVPEMARFQILQKDARLKPKDKRVKGVLNELLKYRKSRFYQRFVEHYLDAFHLRDAPPPERERAPAEAPSQDLGSQDQDQDQDQDQKLQQQDLPRSPVQVVGEEGEIGGRGPVVQGARAAPDAGVGTLASRTGGGTTPEPEGSRGGAAAGAQTRVGGPPAPLAPADDFPRTPVLVEDASGPWVDTQPLWPHARQFRDRVSAACGRTAPYPVGGAAEVWQSLEASVPRLGLDVAVELCRQRDLDCVARRLKRPGTLSYFAKMLADAAVAPAQRDVRVGMADPRPAEAFKEGAYELRM